MITDKELIWNEIAKYAEDMIELPILNEVIYLSNQKHWRLNIVLYCKNDNSRWK